MAESLREFRRSGRAQLLRIQRSTQQAFSNLPEVIAVLDLEGEVEVSTAAAASVFGLKPGASVFQFVPDSLRGLIRECIYSVRTVESAKEKDLIQRFVGTEERYYRPKGVPVLDSDGKVTGAVLILADVTRQREQDELKRSVIATVSHQLKTPLTSVRMAVHLLLEEKIGALTEKQVDLLIAARDDAERLCGILDNLLDISRLDSAAASAESYPAVTSTLLVMDSVEPFRRAAQEKGVSLIADLPGDLPDVLADPMEIGHVFANLLANALKYTAPGGRITVSAQADDRLVRFSIADTGKGIPREHLGRIFEQFFRVPGQEQASGAGLGLSIARRIVQAHGGILEAESIEGKGTAFSFSLKQAGTTTQQEPDHD